MAARPDGAVAPRPRRRELLEWYASQAGMSASDLDQMGQRRELEPPTHVDADADSDGEGVEGVQLPEKEPPQGWASWSRAMLGAAYVYAVGESGPSVETAPEASSIDELLAQHAPSIELLRQCMAADPLFEPDRHDSLWLLRFFLSHKDVARAGEAARRALGIRKQQHLDEIGAIVRSCPPQEWPVYGVVQVRLSPPRPERRRRSPSARAGLLCHTRSARFFAPFRSQELARVVGVSRSHPPLSCSVVGRSSRL